MKYKLTILFFGALLLAACSRETVFEDIPKTKDVGIILAVNSLAINDPAAINQDETFGSLAIYLFNNDATFTKDHVGLLPSFASTNSMEIPISGVPGDKILYLIANYAGKSFKLTNGTSITLSETTTKQQLDDITTETSTGFSPSELMMIGKKEISIASTDNGTQFEMLLHRLQARVDVHIYKGPKFATNSVELESVKLYKQILNSDVDFDYTVNTPQMLTSPIYNNQLVSNVVPLAPYTTGTVLNPSDADARFYSYQNLVTVLSPIQVSTPYLEIVVNVNGSPKTYKGYFTDSTQVENQYSLLQNNVYQILAILDTDSKIVLDMNVLPWNHKDLEHNRPITSNDFEFGAWGTSWGGMNGKAVHSNIGGIEDAVFEFELKAPIGAAWTATLTNGLDFAFTSSTAGTGLPTVSQGVTSIGSPSIIAVRALKRWTGVSRETEFYITVNGNEAPINPIVGGNRMYEGTDTRIKIKQVASSN
jgi:hypothetical protein